MKKTTNKPKRLSKKDLAAHRAEEQDAGVDDEFRYNPGRLIHARRSRRHDVKPGETDLRNVKVTISIRLDADIIEFFKQRATAPGVAPYQTQINNALRSIVDFDRVGNQTPEHWEKLADELETEVRESKRILGRDAKQFEGVYASKLMNAAQYRVVAGRLRERQ